MNSPPTREKERRMSRRFWWATLVLPLCCCASAVLLPGAQGVRHVTDVKAVADCKLLGEVETDAPFNSPSDPETTLRNSAAVLGADAVLKTSGANILRKPWRGAAYLCGARPKAQ